MVTLGDVNHGRGVGSGDAHANNNVPTEFSKIPLGIHKTPHFKRKIRIDALPRTLPRWTPPLPKHYTFRVVYDSREMQTMSAIWGIRWKFTTN